MNLSSEHPWQLMKRAMVAAAMFSGIAILIMAVGGKPLLSSAFGKDFVAAYPALLIMLGISLLTIVSFPLPSTLYALDRPDGPLKARLVGTGFYFAAIGPMAHVAGLTGAAWCFLLSNALLVATLAIRCGKTKRVGVN